MAVELVAVAFDADDPVRVSRFWGALLGREVTDADRGALLPGGNSQVGLHFVAAATERTGPNRLHLHLTSDSRPAQRRIVATATSLGARPLDVGQSPEEGHVVLCDPAGNEFCVIEPGNSFLDGCGRLGEVACDGTRQVGLFWHRALGWPLVWDRDEETAVQSPLGGTKISWGGPPVPPKRQRNRQRLELASTELSADLARLLALGATQSAPRRAGGAELADPDGNEFFVESR
jgi:predicted enzyme related to lactoylglutathione lyase